MAQTINISSLHIEDNRQRSNIDEPGLESLVEDILHHGLYHAPVVAPEGDNSYRLLAGERRIRAIQMIQAKGSRFTYNQQVYQNGEIPVVIVDAEDEIDFEEIELHENILRTDLSWADRARAIARLHRLRSTQSDGQQSMSATARELGGFDETDRSQRGLNEVIESVLLEPHLTDPDVAKAESRRRALRVVENKLKAEKARRRAQEHLSTTMPSTSGPYESGERRGDGEPDEEAGRLPQHPHTLLLGSVQELDALELEGPFEVVITDPPYGIGVDNHRGQSSAWQGSGTNDYEDNLDYATQIHQAIATNSYHLTTEDAFLFLFCDIVHFNRWAELFAAAGWRPWPTPLIWDRSPSGIAPVPDWGPRCCYEAILYARKGKRMATLSSQSDVLKVPLKAEHARPGEKPVELYRQLLARAAHPGDRVIDFCCGTGPVFPAAHKLDLIATGMDIDEVAYGICVERLENLEYE